MSSTKSTFEVSLELCNTPIQERTLCPCGYAERKAQLQPSWGLNSRTTVIKWKRDRQHSLPCFCLGERKCAEHLKAMATCRGEKKILGTMKTKAHTARSLAYRRQTPWTDPIPASAHHCFHGIPVPSCANCMDGGNSTQRVVVLRCRVSGMSLPKEVHKPKPTP